MAKLPDIPSIGTSEASVGVRRVFDAIRRAFSEINKSGGVETGSSVIDRIEQAVSSATSGSSSTHTPPKPVNVLATGGFAYITVSWDDPQFAYLAHAEVWRSTGTVISDATRVGTTNATMFSDLPPSQSLSASYHYWVRFVSNDGTPQYGPWSDMVTASTADDPAYVLEVLAGEIEADWFAIRNTSGTDVKYPFVVDATYGVVMDSALIKDGTITNAKIASLAVDKLYAASGTMASVIIGTGHITNAMIGNTIQSSNYSGTAGWYINKDGTAIFNDVYARGDVEATSLKSNTLMVNTGNINDLAVTTLKIQDNAVVLPVGAFSAGSVNATTVQSVTVASTGAPVFLSVSVKLFFVGSGSPPFSLSIKRNSTTLATYDIPTRDIGVSTYEVNQLLCPSIIDTGAPSGNVIYSVTVSNSSINSSNRSLTAIVLKK